MMPFIFKTSLATDLVTAFFENYKLESDHFVGACTLHWFLCRLHNLCVALKAYGYIIQHVSNGVRTQYVISPVIMINL